MTIQPKCSLLVYDTSVIPVSRYFENDDAVVVVDDAMLQQRGNHVAGLERCLNDPDRLKGPAIIARTSERVVHDLPIAGAEFPA